METTSSELEAGIGVEGASSCSSACRCFVTSFRPLGPLAFLLFRVLDLPLLSAAPSFSVSTLALAPAACWSAPVTGAGVLVDGLWPATGVALSKASSGFKEASVPGRVTPGPVTVVDSYPGSSETAELGRRPSLLPSPPATLFVFFPACPVTLSVCAAFSGVGCVACFSGLAARP
ncbi:hypothetical protein N658DRAFT_89376 [Parathielavia hyrcaniae]|uniref:Uncharacterized protein n=1 Tax=Parathielavia hyrcaniae TaxID=113614 RepID=A0AAN6PTK1_9PEZI|nr:hypothetical protein N658DRAFT_89376 [Parathielavia hyrcaniae]